MKRNSENQDTVFTKAKVWVSTNKHEAALFNATYW